MSGNPPRGTRGGRGRGGGGGSSERQNLPFHPRGGYQGHGESSQQGGQRGRGQDNSFGRGRGSGRGGRGDKAPAAPVAIFRSNEAKEDAAQKQKENDHLVKLLKAEATNELPIRPAYGTKGEKVILWANYFNLQTNKDVGLFRYEIKIVRVGGNTAPPPAITKRLVVLFIEEHLKPLHIDAVSDLRATLISRQRLSEDALTAEITYRAEGEPEPEDDARVYNVKLGFSGTLTLGTLLDYSTSTNGSTALLRGRQQLVQREELIQALNLVVGYEPKTSARSFTVGRNLHVSSAQNQDRFDLGGGLEALRAFVFSVRAATERLLINVQIKNLPFYPAAPLPTLAQAWKNSRVDLRGLVSLLNMLSVEVTHIQRTSKSGRPLPRYKTILGLATTGDGRGLAHRPIVPREGAGPEEVSFWLNEGAQPKPSDGKAAKGSSKGKKKGKAPAPSEPGSASPASGGRYITVYDFFRSRYPSVPIPNRQLPVVNVGTRADPSYLPMDVCVVRPGQVARSKISSDQTRSMLNFAVRQPSANASSISTAGLNLLGLQGANQYMTGFGMAVEPRLITVPGRVLTAPTVTYFKKTQTVYSASWNLTSSRLLHGVSLTNWAVLTISNRGPNGPAGLGGFVGEFKAKLVACGIPASNPTNLDVLEVRPGQEQRIDARIEAAITQFKGQLSFLVVVIPEDTAIYNRVKYVCDIKEGILSQCVVDRKFAKERNDQYFTNVGLKINLKLGGVNHGIQKGTFGNVSFKSTMFVGIDVTHPSPGSTATAPSVASIVSSVDEHLGQWPAAIRVQTARQEMVDALDELLQGQLKLWRKKNQNKLPNNIIVYRDGVSEGQYQLVLEKELPALQKAIDAVYTPADKKIYNPRLSIIIVGKRHHTRFYPTSDSTSVTDMKTGNPKNGTVVDRGVTEVGNWDFFLQAHTALKGTAKPAHYYVIYDEAVRGGGANRQTAAGAADHLEELTHSLCYLFGRATKAVSICPPAYYADLVCERARCYLAQHFAPSPATSSAPSVASNTGSSAAPMQNFVDIHPNLREKMFYI